MYIALKTTSFSSEYEDVLCKTKKTRRRYAVDHSQAIHHQNMKFTTSSTNSWRTELLAKNPSVFTSPEGVGWKVWWISQDSFGFQRQVKQLRRRQRNQGSGSYGRGRVQLDSIRDSCRHEYQLLATRPSCLKDSAILSPCSPLDPEHTHRQSDAKEKQVMIGRKEGSRLVSLGVSSAFANNSPPL
jgi:hypothetical protein